jgi:hemoglobin
MRHAQFSIDTKARDAWLSAMRIAIDGVEIKEDLKAELWSYCEMAANSMVNQPD